MNWINEYKNKAKKMKLLGLLFVLFTTLAEIAFIYSVRDVVNEVWPAFIVLGIAWVGLTISITCLMCKVVYRKYNDNYIGLYIAPVKNYLVIHDEVQYEGGPFTHHYYGQLRDGTDITVKLGSFGDVKFAIGAFDNHNLSIF